MLHVLPAATAATLLLMASVGATQPQISPAPASPPQKTAPRVNADAATISDFKKRVDGYVELHKKLEATLPKLPAQTDPYQIDKHQRALARLI
jgi:hypothetical protein